MQKAASHFEGMHDFRSFTADDPDEKSTKVDIMSISVREHGDLILISITGSHFLWSMVRRMVGVIAEVGRGKMKADEIPILLKKPSNVIIINIFKCFILCLCLHILLKYIYIIKFYF